ncbi:ElaA protein [Actinocatenispora thailandica]|uniref:ElaA protein n=1 Tax=Actinocatenispora thailandica TaxID=227318 RepID=A0A7R7DQA7_9ACTN|nr:GNAT family N-acetyltransferase [Actinocatenispora thailandica]BCJ35935.1 ElaA protein [Actinocatenispora thailandica]
MSDLTLRRARFAQLSGPELYEILRLRVDVFVVEQDCPYPELDGRDTEPDTVHLWYERGGRIASYLRILAEPGGTARIGRVCTAVDERGAGLAGQLLDQALAAIGPRTVALSAQSHLTAFYARYGFRPDGEGYLEDGIPHTPMVRSRDHPPAT